jgi:hypothetical protein
MGPNLVQETTMTEKDIRDHINAFLRSKIPGVLLPASMGLGLALGGCGSSAMEANPDGSGDVQTGGGGGTAGYPGGFGGKYGAPGSGGSAGYPGGHGGVYAAFGGSNGTGGMAGRPGGFGGMYAAFGGSGVGGSAGIKGSGGTVYGIGGSPRTGGVSGTGARDSGADGTESDSGERRDTLVSEAGVALEVSSDD